MLSGILCLLIALTTQSASPTFYVGTVEVLTTYDSRYVLRRTNQIFTSDIPIQQSDIDCLVAELKATGIFADVQTELTSSKHRNFRKLLISTKNADRIDEFTIGEVVLSGLPEVDGARFQAALSKRGVKRNTFLMKYSFSELEERVSEALREVYPSSVDKKPLGLAWVTITTDGVKRVKLIVSPAYSVCGHSPGN